MASPLAALTSARPPCYPSARTGETAINIFRSETAPYFLALIVSAIGWFAANIAEETNSRAIALYSIEPSGDRVRVRIENISRSAIIRNARFLFACDDLRAGCFRVGADGMPERQITAPPPLYTRDIAPSGDALALVLDVTMVANSMLDVTLFPQQPATAGVTFRYVPDGARPENILFLEKGGTVAFFLAHYFLLMIWALYAACALLMLVVAVQIRDHLRSRNNPGPKDAPSRHDVTVRLDDPERG